MKMAAAGVLLMLATVDAGAQSGPPAPEAYRPGLGDLMTMTVQPRHIKLLLGGHAQNWAYTRYELHEMREAFERAVRVWPRYRGLPLGGMVDSIVKGPMDQIDKAIEAKDEVAFDAGYQQLTEGCNACHQAANVGHIVIRVPNASTFPNQEFRPQQR